MVKIISWWSNGCIFDVNEWFLFMLDCSCEDVVGCMSLEIGMWDNLVDCVWFF